MGEKLEPVDINDSRTVGKLVNALLSQVDELTARVNELENAATSDGKKSKSQNN